MRKIARHALLQLGAASLHLPRVKFLSRVLTTLNLLPSIATFACVSRPIRQHSSINCTQTCLIAGPRSFRKSASCGQEDRPVSHNTSTLRPASRSSRLARLSQQTRAKVAALGPPCSFRLLLCRDQPHIARLMSARARLGTANSPRLQLLQGQARDCGWRLIGNRKD